MQDDIFLIDDETSIPIEIRYEGKYADQHAIPMNALAESLDGFGRIYAVVGHFVSTGEYALQLQALDEPCSSGSLHDLPIIGRVIWRGGGVG